MKSRTRARGIALQALYEIDLVGHSPDQVLQQRLAEDPQPIELAEFIRQIVWILFLRGMHPNGRLTRLRLSTVISCALPPGNLPVSEGRR
jgi:hypothetical protein